MQTNRCGAVCVRSCGNAKGPGRTTSFSRLVDADASEAEIVDMCSLLIGAGNFTTTDLIGNALLRFTEADRQRIPEFVDETLKLDPPLSVSETLGFWRLSRLAAQQFRLGVRFCS